MNGKLIVFEGIDGSGKSTQAEKLSIACMKKNLRTHLSAEPTNGPIGQFIRESMLSGKYPVSDLDIIQMLYAADRRDHVTKVGGLMDQKQKYADVVITDRFDISSIAYGSYHFLAEDSMSAFWVMVQEMYDMNTISRKLVDLPDLVVFVDVPADVVLQRIHARSGNPEIFDQLETQKALETAYKHVIDYYKRGNPTIQFIIVDGNRPEDVIHEEIKERVFTYLREEGILQ